MFKKSLVLTAIFLSSTALAELPTSFTKAEISAIIDGDGSIQDEHTTWRLEHNFIERPGHALHGIQVSKATVLSLLANDPGVTIERGIVTHDTAKYLVTGETHGTIKIYTLTFARQP